MAAMRIQRDFHKLHLLHASLTNRTRREQMRTANGAANECSMVSEA